MSSDEVRSRFVDEPLITVAKMAETWFKHAGEFTFHDPLAATLIFHPEICTFESGQVNVSYGKGDKNSGHTQLVPGSGPDRVAKTVNAEAFFAEYFKVVHGA